MSVVLRTVQVTIGQESNGPVTVENNTFADSSGVSDSMRVTETKGPRGHEQAGDGATKRLVRPLIVD